MQKFEQLVALGWPFARESVDTDQLIPARFMSRSRKDGYGGYLLHDLRFDVVGTPKNEIRLDDARYKGAAVLVARRNFGSGSSREAAVYALWDFGFRCVIAPSFGDIFRNNAIKNGLLAAQVSEADAEALLGALAMPQRVDVAVDLGKQTIMCGGFGCGFFIDPSAKERLLNGWDELDLTRQHAAEINAYRELKCRDMPWVFPQRSADAAR